MTSLAYCGINGDPCGYCGSEEDSFLTEALIADTLTAEQYQMLMDRTWRRSGKLIYRPIYEATCCKPFTIRLEATRFLKYVGADDDILAGTDLIDVLAEKLVDGIVAPKLRLVLTPASFEAESFELYSKYQQLRHGDPPEKITSERYTNFLISSPLRQEQHTRTFHLKWYLDDRLIVVGVLDILTVCISSVYLFYEPDLSSLSLGTVSALFEIALIRKYTREHPELAYYYLGYYIDGCSKMRYKGEFGPADILDPAELSWISLEDARDRLF